MECYLGLGCSSVYQYSGGVQVEIFPEMLVLFCYKIKIKLILV